MLNIQIVSDIHAEFWGKKSKFNFIKPSAPILALLGDICCCGSDDDFEIFKRFINEVLPYYENIIMVSGNHEYYFNPTKKSTAATVNNTMDAIDAKIKAFFKETSPKLHYLNNTSLKMTVGKTTYLIVGSTLWSWIPEDQRVQIQSSMNDYRYCYVQEGNSVRHINATDIANKHLKNYKYIRSQIRKAQKVGQKVIVFTHHKPYTSPTFDPNTLDVAYESDLTVLMKKSPIVLWAYGHTHVADDSLIEKTRMYSNPKGYPSQKTKYIKDAVVKV